MSVKELAFEAEARSSLLRGVEKLSAAVKSTLGPRGPRVDLTADASFSTPASRALRASLSKAKSFTAIVFVSPVYDFRFIYTCLDVLYNYNEGTFSKSSTSVIWASGCTHTGIYATAFNKKRYAASGSFLKNQKNPIINPILPFTAPK
jgi:hypothetical protein